MSFSPGMNQNVAGRMRLDDLFDRVNGSVDVSKVAEFFREMFERAIENFDGIKASGNFNDRGVVERAGERFGFDGGAGDDQLEVGAARQEQLEVAEQEINVEAAFVRFVDDDAIVLAEIGIALHLSEQHAVRHHFDLRVARCLVVETNLGTDFTSVSDIEFLRETTGNREHRDAARLRATDHAALRKAGFEAHLRNLRRLPRTRLTREHQDLMFAQETDDFVLTRSDREFRRILNDHGRPI
jgi:hypothetical protein